MTAFRHVQETTAVVVRKGVTTIGAPLGAWRAIGGLAYALEIRESGAESNPRTVYLDWSRSRDFYRIPIGQPIKLRIGREGTKIGHWVESWSPLEEGAGSS